MSRSKAVSGGARTVAAACALGAVALLALGACASPRTAEPTLAVLGGPDMRANLWLVDAERRSVVDQITLRSLALVCDPTIDGGVVTAQCGGVGTDADHRLGIVEAGGGTRYVELPAPNPSDVVACGSRAVVLHGFDAGTGMWLSSVELETGSVAATATAPGSPLQLARAGERVLLTSATDRGAVELLEIEPTSLAVRRIATLPLGYASVVADTRYDELAPRSVLVVGFEDSELPSQRAASSRALRVELDSGRVTGSWPLPGLSAGAFAGAADGETLAILDAASAEPGADDGVALFATADLKPVARIDGIRPLAVVLHEGSVIVADGATDGLRYFSRRGSPVAHMRLGPLGDSVHMDVLSSGISRGRR